MILECGLGWNPEQIAEQLSLPLGSTERLIPDILVQKDVNNSFLIEVKKASHKKTNGDTDQLVSYMKQLEIPVGIYWGESVEVYWKTIGDGSSPILLLNLNFNVLGEDGEVFVSLFSEKNYSVENVLKFKNERQAQAIFEAKVKDAVDEILSSEFREKVKELMRWYLLDKCGEETVVDTALEKVFVSILAEPSAEVSEEETININNIATTKIRANRGTAQRYAYNLIRQIIEKNKNLNFDQLFAIFRRKNRIEKVSAIKDESRWFLNAEDIITLSDGTKVAVSNQWGFNGASKPNMDNLREVARTFGIDTSLPN